MNKAKQIRDGYSILLETGEQIYTSHDNGFLWAGRDEEPGEDVEEKMKEAGWAWDELFTCWKIEV